MQGGEACESCRGHDLKRDRPWVIVHVEDGPPAKLPPPSEVVTDFDYFQPRWLEKAETRPPIKWRTSPYLLRARLRNILKKKKEKAAEPANPDRSE